MKSKKIVLLLTVIIVVSTMACYWPISIINNMNGCLVSQDKGVLIKTISIKLKGTCYHRFICQDKFNGTVEIEGKSYEVQTYEPGSFQSMIKSFESKLKGEALFTSVRVMKDGMPRGLGGTIMISDNYSKIMGNINAVSNEYGDQSLMFAGPADTFVTAEKIINEI